MRVEGHKPSARSYAKAIQLLGLVARADGVLKLYDLEGYSIAEIESSIRDRPTLQFCIKNGWLQRREDTSKNPPVWFTLTGAGEDVLNGSLTTQRQPEEWPFEDNANRRDRLADHLASTDAALQCARSAAIKVDHESLHYPKKQKDYDEGWANRLRKVVSYIEAGHRTIPEIEANLRAWWMGSRWKAGEHIKFVINGKVVSLPARSGHLGFRQLIADTVIDAARPDTYTVFDLGAGNGDSLFAVWCEGRLLRPRYVACEPSAAGRKTMRIIASLDPRLHLETRYFDYRAPSLSSEISKSGHAVVMSTQSIEQVDQVHSELIKVLCELSPEVTGVHFEPIGWQFPGKVKNSFVEEHRQRCLEKHYNENFWSLLKRAEADGLIEIIEAQPFAYGYDYNPISKIIWKKIVRTESEQSNRITPSRPLQG